MSDYENKTECAVLMAVCGKDDARWFSQAIDSVLFQEDDWINIRVYLIVDGPIGIELQRAIDARSDLIHHLEYLPTNRGLASALNTAIDLLGDEPYAFRMDADDISLPGRFRRQVHYMDQNPSVDVSGGSIVEFRDGAEVGLIRTYPFDNFQNQICKGTIVAHPTVVFRRSVLLRFRYDESEQYRMNEDLELWFRMLQGGDVTFGNISDPLLLFRMSADTMKRRSWTKAKAELLAYLRGIKALHGSWTVRMAYPIIRFFIRLLPAFVNAQLYHSRIRRLVFGEVRWIDLSSLSKVSG